MFLIVVQIVLATAIIEVTDQTYFQTINHNPYVLMQFYTPQCPHCIALNKEFELAAKQLPNDIQLARIDSQKYADFIKAFQIKSFPTLYFYRLTMKEEYTGNRTAQGIVQWLGDNARPLLREFQQKWDLEQFLKNRVSLVYFPESNDYNPQMIKEMKKIGKKYKTIPMVLVSQPQLREEFQIPPFSFVLLYPQSGEPINFAGYLPELEQFIIREGFPIIFSGTASETEIIQHQKLPILVCIDDSYDQYTDIANQYNGSIRFVVLNSRDIGGILYFQNYLKVDQLQLSHYYYQDSTNDQSIIFENYDKMNQYFKKSLKYTDL